MPTGVYERTQEHRNILSKSAIRRGVGKWMAGKTNSLESNEKRRIASKTNPNIIRTQFKKGSLGEKSKAWKGDNVGYGGLHGWIRSQKGKPTFCENDSTHKSKRYEWSSISRKYTRDLNDYRSLCLKCHRKYDACNKDFIRVKNIIKINEVN